MFRTTEDARALLRAAQEIHIERHGARTFAPGTHLPLQAAAWRAGIDPGRLRYHDAIEELRYEDAIRWSTSARHARGDKHYVITRRGLEMLREDQGSDSESSQESNPEETERGRTGVGSRSQQGGGAAGRTDRVEEAPAPYDPGLADHGRTPAADERTGERA
jgi:hypothetical protein